MFNSSKEKQLFINEETKIVINFKLMIICISLISSLLIGGYGIINSKINKLNNKIIENHICLEKVEIIDSKLNLLLQIFDVAQENKIPDIDMEEIEDIISSKYTYVYTPIRF